MINIILFFGGLLGFFSVMVAAYIDHASALHLTEKSLHSLLTAVKYHQFYAFVISLFGLIVPLQTNTHIKRWLMITVYLFIFGIILFSFSIYISSFFHVANIIYLTPVGGILLMAGWLSLIRTALLKK